MKAFVGMIFFLPVELIANVKTERPALRAPIGLNLLFTLRHVAVNGMAAHERPPFRDCRESPAEKGDISKRRHPLDDSPHPVQIIAPSVFSRSSPHFWQIDTNLVEMDGISLQPG